MTADAAQFLATLAITDEARTRLIAALSALTTTESE